MQIGLFHNPRVDPSLEQKRLGAFTDLLRNGQTTFQVLDNMQIQRWEKVVWNAAWNSLTAITMVDTQTWLHSSEDATPFTRQLMQEVINIARGCGVPLQDELIDQLMDKINAMPGIGSSMQTDCKNGRFRGPRMPRSIGAVIPWISHSQMLQDFANTHTWSNSKRRAHLSSLNKRYGFRMFMGADNRWRFAVDQEPDHVKPPDLADSDPEVEADKTTSIQLQEIQHPQPPSPPPP